MVTLKKECTYSGLYLCLWANGVWKNADDDGYPWKLRPQRTHALFFRTNILGQANTSNTSGGTVEVWNAGTNQRDNGSGQGCGEIALGMSILVRTYIHLWDEGLGLHHSNPYRS